MAAVNVHSALLIVLGEPTTEQHVGLILHRVIDGLSAWNHSSRGFLDHDKPQVDLNTELRNFLNTNVSPEHLETGGSVLRYNGTHVYLEILVNPAVQSLKQCLSHFLIHASTYKHIIHAGAAFAGNGSWILQDGTLSMQDFSRVLHSPDVTTALTQVTPGSALVVSCFPEGEWNEHGAKHHGLDKLGHVHVGELSGNSGIDPSCAADLQAYLQQFVVYTPLEALMPESNVVGSVRFRRPTLHIFPAGQGDAALFGVSGFTMLFDGGFSRKTCFWDFLRHVDRVDALVISRLSSNNIVGISSFLDRLATSECHPKLGYAFGNIPAYHRAPAASDESLKNPLLLSVHDEGAKISERLGHLHLKPHPCAAYVGPASKHPEPLTLYQKVGQGRLDMYVLNPTKDSKELNEFVDAWKKGIHKHGSLKFSTKPGSSGTDFTPPPVDQTSIAALLVWRPADPNDQIIRVLYPGSCSQEKILSGLDKLKHLDFLKHPTCTPASLESKTAATAVPKKGLAVKATEAVKSAAGSVSPKPASPAKSPAAAKTPAAAAAAGALAAAVSSVAPAAPKAAEGIAKERHVEPAAAAAAQPMPREPDLFELSPIGEPLVDVAPPPLKEMSPADFPTTRAQEEMLLEDFGPSYAHNQSPTLEPEHVADVHAYDRPLQEHVTPPGAESENFHREQVAAAAEPDLLGGEREQHAGFGVAAEPTKASPFEVVDVSHAIEANVLRLSHDQLHDCGDHARADVVEKLSPVSPDQNTQSELFQHQHQQPVAGQALDSPLEGGHGFDDREIRAPAEPILREHPQSLPVHDRSVEEKFGHQSPESPLLIADHGPPSPQQQQQHSPGTQQRMFSLNPEAPVFVPKFPDLSPSTEPDFGRNPFQHHRDHQEHTTSPMDPFPEKGFGEGARIQPQFSNGSTNLFDDNAWPAEAAVSPKRAGDAAASPFGDEPAAAQSSPEGTRKNVDEAMKEWGHPLGLPTPPVATKDPQRGATSATKSKANGPASGGKEQANKSAASSTATSTRRVTTTTTKTSTASGAAAAKTGTSAEAKPATASTASKKSPTSAPKAGVAAARPASAATKSATATASKAAPIARPSSATATAAKTAAPAKSAGASKKPALTGVSYYVDLTYVPHQGNPHYVNADFFKHVRSRHYVLSTLYPSNDILEALLVGKKSWNLPEEEVTLIPTYDSDTLSLWMALHKDELASESIDMAPSCCRCTVNLEEQQGAKCAAYRLEL